MTHLNHTRSAWTARLFLVLILCPLPAHSTDTSTQISSRLKAEPPLTAGLPLPAELVSLYSPSGKRMLARSRFKDAYWQQTNWFESQINLGYCGVAVSAMVLNSLGVPPPATPELSPYFMFNQTNFFTPGVRQMLTPEQVQRSGMSLDQLGQALATFPTQVTVTHADQTNTDEFRKLAKKILTRNSGRMIVNYDRISLGQVGSGHHSSLAAYDQVTDQFLIMDVAKFKYPPVWLKTNLLFKAMMTRDPDSGLYRGYVVVESLPEAKGSER